MTVDADGAAATLERFGELLLAMSYADPEVRPLLDLEGLKAVARRAARAATRRSRRPSTSSGFYDDGGQRHRRRLSTLSDLGLRPRRPPAVERALRAAAGRAAGSTVRGTGPGARACTCAPGAAQRGPPRVDGRATLSSSGARRGERPLARRRARPAAPARTGIVDRPAADVGARGAGRAGRGGRAGRSRFDLDEQRRGVGRRRAAALRPGRRRPVGPGDRHRLGRRRRPAAPRSRRPSSR